MNWRSEVAPMVEKHLANLPVNFRIMDKDEVPGRPVQLLRADGSNFVEASIQPAPYPASFDRTGGQRDVRSGDKSWYARFWDYVNSGHYSKFARDLEQEGVTSEGMAQVNKSIRSVYLKKLMEDFPQLGELSLDEDGSTVIMDDWATRELTDAEPTFTRLMIGNHGAYMEMDRPDTTGMTMVGRHSQYNEWRTEGGTKFYDQFEGVNYADYQPGKWYSSIYDYGDKQYTHPPRQRPVLPRSYDPANVAMFGLSRDRAKTPDWLVGRPVSEQQMATVNAANGETPPDMREFFDTFRQLGNFTSGGLNPITIMGKEFKSSELLYQALRYSSRPDVQELIRRQGTNPMLGKEIAHAPEFTPWHDEDWESKKVDVMRWVMRAKVAANYDTFAEMFAKSGNLELVEHSYKDSYWGAKFNEETGRVQGANVAGRLMMEIREQFR
ncbi:MAG: NADAR family protein, partial [Thermomicrobiales bacterium]